MKISTRKLFLFGFIASFLLAIFVAPLSGLLLVDKSLAVESFTQDTNPRANFWRAIRAGNEGYSAIKTPESNILIHNGGQNWRAMRNGPLANYGAWWLGIAFAMAALFYLIRGKLRIENGRSGIMVERWSLFDRTLHWFTAILFIILAMTGLSMLYGKAVIIPVMGKEAFAAYAALGKSIHNYLGPAFAAGLLIEIIKWLPTNIPKGRDLVWFLKGGGAIGHIHASAGRMNGGEKVWFWGLTLIGGLLTITGLLLDFPNLGTERSGLQLSHILHSGSGIILTGFAFWHIYLGTIGTEGALEGMVKGEVDAEWAKQHHDIWYEEQKKQRIHTSSKQKKTRPAGFAFTHKTFLKMPPVASFTMKSTTLCEAFGLTFLSSAM